MGLGGWLGARMHMTMLLGCFACLHARPCRPAVASWASCSCSPYENSPLLPTPPSPIASGRPIRFVPLLFAYGNSSSSSDAGGAPSGGLSLGQPLIAGSFNLSLSDNSAQDVVFWNVTSTASPAYTIWLGHVPLVLAALLVWAAAPV